MDERTDSGGHLHAAMVSVADLFGALRIEPASVQRAFEWTSGHAQVFLDDLMKAAAPAIAAAQPVLAAPAEPSAATGPDDVAEPDFPGLPASQSKIVEPDAAIITEPDAYFLGPMVIQPRGDDLGVHVVFDGLQRLTTLTVLMSVLRDLLADDSDPMHARLAACVNTPEGWPRLRGRGNGEVLAKLIQKPGEAIKVRRTFRDRPDTRSRMLEIAADFRDRLKALPLAVLRALTLFLLHRVAVCRIDPGSDVMGRQIFVTTNDRGLRLDQTDIFRSQLGLVMGEDQNGLDQLMARWRQIEESLSGTEHRQQFLQAVDVLQRRQWSGQRGLTDLGEYLGKAFNAETIFHWIDDLEPRALAWQRLWRARSPEARDTLCDALRRLHIIEWPEWHPLALYYLERAHFAVMSNQLHLVTRVKARLGELADACMAMTLAGLSPDVRQRIVLRALTDLRNDRNPLRVDGPLRLTPDQRRRARETVSGPIYMPDIYRPFVRWLEASLWTDEPVPAWILAATTEHVLPRSLPPGSAWAIDFPDEETRSAMAHRCGNLACLEWKLNEEADRKDFGDKVHVYEQSRFAARTLQEVMRTPRWNADALSQRSDAIAQMTIARLNLFEAPPA